MKLVAQVKLRTTAEQNDALKRTLLAANRAANYVSDLAWEAKQFSKYDLQRLAYYAIRASFGLSAQAAVRVIAKVADAYKLDKETRRIFRPSGSIAFDARILSYRLSDQTVSIWTLDGRLRIPFVCGEHQLQLLAAQRGESDLLCRSGRFYLLATCEVEEAAQNEVSDYLGVDLGVANIAVDSDGTVFQGKTVKGVRCRHRRLRTKLQRKGTKATRRRLKKLSGRERRFATWVNHNISKSIVAKAKDTARGIALEDLTYIRKRVTARKHQRATLHSWSFF